MENEVSDENDDGNDNCGDKREIVMSRPTKTLVWQKHSGDYGGNDDRDEYKIDVGYNNYSHEYEESEYEYIAV